MVSIYKISWYSAVVCWWISGFLVNSRIPHDLIQWRKKGLITTPRSFAMLMVPSSVSLARFFFGGVRNVFKLWTKRCFFCRLVVFTWGKFSFWRSSIQPDWKNQIRTENAWDQHYVFLGGNYSLQVFVYRCVHIALSQTIDVSTVHLLTFTM